LNTITGDSGQGLFHRPEVTAAGESGRAMNQRREALAHLALILDDQHLYAAIARYG